MPHWGQLIFLLMFTAFVPHSIKRRKEVDALGNAELRYFGPALFVLLVGVFFLYQAIYHHNDSFYLRHPESFYVLLSFSCIGALSSLFFFFRESNADQ